MRRVIYAPEAEADLWAIARHIAEDNLEAAERSIGGEPQAIIPLTEATARPHRAARKPICRIPLPGVHCRHMLKLKKATEQRVADKVRAGSFQSEDDVVRHGLDLIEAQEAFRQAVAEGEAQLDRGEYVTAEQSQQRIRAVIERHRPRG